MQIFNSKFFILGILALIILSIPLTIFFIRQQQTTQGSAEAATTLSLEPSAVTDVAVGEAFTLDVMIDPGGVNIVSVIRMQLEYDNTVLELDSIEPQDPFSVILEQLSTASGSSSIAFGIGADVTQAVQTPTIAAKVTFTALQATTQPTTVAFAATDPNQTQVLSLATGDNPGENVLATTNPATVSISGDGSTQPTPTTGAGGPTPTTPVGGQGPTTVPNQPPVCSSLGADRALTGTAPYSIAFTATGSDPDGTVSQVTFNYGDGPVENITQGDGIGTNAVSVQRSHTYNNPGTYQVSASLTDNDGEQSTTATCSTTVTVSEAQASGGSGGSGGSNGSGGSGGTGGNGGSDGSPQPTIAPPGSLATTLGIAGGVLIIILGGVLLLIL